MSAKIMGQVYDCDLPHSEQAVLLAMADHADHRGENVYPSIGLVAWKTGYSARQVRRIIRKLEKRAVLVRVRVAVDHRATEYRIVLNSLAKKLPRDLDRADIMSSRGRTPGHNRADILTHRADIAVSSEPSVEPSNESNDAKIAPMSAREAARAWLATQGPIPLEVHDRAKRGS